jgi:hypothetical protein
MNSTVVTNSSTYPRRPTPHRWDKNTKMDLRETGWEGETRLIWLRIGIEGRFL